MVNRNLDNILNQFYKDGYNEDERLKKDKMNINVSQGNALDLSMYEDNTFDIMLVLGPLYHLFKKEETCKVIEEAIRVTKPCEKIYLAFILFDLTMLTWGFQEGNIYDNYGTNMDGSMNNDLLLKRRVY